MIISALSKIMSCTNYTKVMSLRCRWNLMSFVNQNVTPYFRCHLSTAMYFRHHLTTLFKVSFVNHNVTPYLRCHVDHHVTPYFRCQSQCHSVFQMSFVNRDATSYFRCHLSTTMSLHIFKCHTVTKLLLAVVRQHTAWQRSISMATSVAPPLWKRSLLRGSVTCNVRVWSCRTYRVKTPALLEGGQRWMLHVSINNNHIKKCFTKYIYVATSKAM